MKKFLLLAVLSTFAASTAFAEDSRDQAYGKHDMGSSPAGNMDRNTEPTGGMQSMTTTRSTARGVARHSKKMKR